MLVAAAMHLTGTPSIDAPVLARGEDFIRKEGGIAALKRHYGKHKALAAPILTICALADGAVGPVISSVRKFRAEYEAHVENGCPHGAQLCEVEW